MPCVRGCVFVLVRVCVRVSVRARPARKSVSVCDGRESEECVLFGRGCVSVCECVWAGGGGGDYNENLLTFDKMGKHLNWFWLVDLEVFVYVFVCFVVLVFCFTKLFRGGGGGGSFFFSLGGGGGGGAAQRPSNVLIKCTSGTGLRRQSISGLTEGTTRSTVSGRGYVSTNDLTSLLSTPCLQQ